MKFKKLLSTMLAASLNLGLSSSHLAVYTHSDPRPLQILPYDAAMFSDADRDKLEKGIPFSTAAELSRLLEDYTS